MYYTNKDIAIEIHSPVLKKMLTVLNNEKNLLTVSSYIVIPGTVAEDAQEHFNSVTVPVIGRYVKGLSRVVSLWCLW